MLIFKHHYLRQALGFCMVIGRIVICAEQLQKSP